MTVDARVEHVGSLLRPVFLRDARDAYARGELTPAGLKAAEDRAVREVLAMQEEIGLPVVGDGEMRRESFQSELTAACDGFTGVDVSAWLWGAWHSAKVGDVTIARPADLAVIGPVRRRRNLAAEEFTFLRACTSRQAKVTLPSPSLFANLWSPQRSVAAYPTLDGFLADVVQVLCEEVAELVRLGCTYIQLDAPHYPLLIDPGWRAFYEERGWPLERWLGYGIELDNAVIDAGRPATFGFHLCRGNQLSRWLVSGGYDAIAARSSAGCTPTGCCWSTTMSARAPSTRCGWSRRQGRGAGPGHHQDIAGRAAGPDQGPARPGTLRGRCGPARAEPAVRLRHLGRRQRHHRRGATRQTRAARPGRPGLPARLNPTSIPAAHRGARCGSRPLASR